MNASSALPATADETVAADRATAAPTAAAPGDADDLLALENQVCFALAVAARGVIGVYRPILEPLGLTHPQYLVMLALWQRSPRTVRDLGEALQLEPATLSPLLKRLEAQGYLTRERSTRDERALDVALTPAGRALREQALAIPPQVVDRLGMSLDELGRLRDRLTEVISAVQHG
ncbi:MarR family winged helix-turn-helix transcriptional regulator [Agromyces sp. NPDC056965]|uniref:MarR family winged helix-turn-helix transcriptional regulator n=1 Tax=Agromyces sp. NPDC056965 TaxID=3345983 RepID=UPI003636999B